jgi:outer membrane protein OmpA-like peptidoglycan-associated protein
MRTTFIAAMTAAGLGLATLGWAGAAGAQNPSADDIINSLKPTGALLGGTRGIRPAKPVVPPAGSPAQKTAAAVSAVPRAAKPAPAATAPTETTAENPSVSLTVQFATGSATLTSAAMHTLDELGRALSSATLASYRFRIEGHTDTVGSQALNQSLSEQRAQAVVAYLESKFGVQADRLQAVGMGEAGLAVPTGAQVPEPRNRRVQVVNLGA